MRLKNLMMMAGVLIAVVVIAAIWAPEENSPRPPDEGTTTRTDAMGLAGSDTPTATSTSNGIATTVARPTTPEVPATATGEVTWVLDGDSIRVRLGDRVEEVRLLGINSPEHDECFSRESRAFLVRLVGGERVRLQRNQTNRDRYYRLLRYVYLTDGVFVNRRLVARGMSISHRNPPDTLHQEKLSAAQQRAQDNEAGLWAPTACGGNGAEDVLLEITEIRYDPPGDETEDLNAEYIVITNNGEPVDLGGWIIRDESSTKRFMFPPGFALDSEASVSIHSGCGQPTATDLYWCSERYAVWNNSGNTVFIQTPSGQMVTSRSY